MPTYSIVTSEGSGAERTAGSYPLVSLSNVSTQVGFIPIGALTTGAFEFRAYKRELFLIFRFLAKIFRGLSLGGDKKV